MSELKKTQSVTVLSDQGLHARAATTLRELVLSFRAKVQLVKDGNRVDGTDVLQILSLGALPGEELLVEASGEEADAAVAALAQLFQNRFGEDLANENPPTQPRTRPMADGDW